MLALSHFADVTQYPVKVGFIRPLADGASFKIFVGRPEKTAGNQVRLQKAGKFRNKGGKGGRGVFETRNVKRGRCFHQTLLQFAAPKGECVFPEGQGRIKVCADPSPREPFRPPLLVRREGTSEY